MGCFTLRLQQKVESILTLRRNQKPIINMSYHEIHKEVFKYNYWKSKTLIKKDAEVKMTFLSSRVMSSYLVNKKLFELKKKIYLL